jgi:excinuclease ABC subunit A
LDEPSIGLHARDTERLLGILRSLQSKGNSIVVVEHDESMMRAADLVVDMGPGAGTLGGSVVAQGSLEEILDTPGSLTGKYLSPGYKMRAAELRSAKTIFRTSVQNSLSVD